MALTTFNPVDANGAAIGPSQASRKMKPRVKIAQFGDGYSQRAPDGINAMAEVWSLTWDSLTKSEADAIETFLTARGGVEAFYWQSPRDSNAAKKWVCSEWDRPVINSLFDTITTTFTRVYDQGS
jgi:phage-related protein